MIIISIVYFVIYFDSIKEKKKWKHCGEIVRCNDVRTLKETVAVFCFAVFHLLMELNNITSKENIIFRICQDIIN